MSGNSLLAPAQPTLVRDQHALPALNTAFMPEFDGKLILNVGPSAGFRNQPLRLSLNGGTVSLTTTDQSLQRFVEMDARRRDASTNLAKSADQVLGDLTEVAGQVLSNVGVSLALTTRIGEKQYALLQHRESDNRLMLLSGYTDAAKFAGPEGAEISLRSQFAANAGAEAAEEFLPSELEGLMLSGNLMGEMARQIASEVVLGHGDSLVDLTSGKPLGLGTPYGLAYSPTLSWTVASAPLPHFLKNLAPDTNLHLGSDILSAGFQYAQQWNAGQIILPFELYLPEGDHGISLFHAEDALNPRDKSQLVTALNKNGTILVEMTEDGELTRSMFHFLNGQLVPAEIDLSITSFSEVFAPSPIVGVTGFVNQGEMPAEEYFAQLSS